jgi:hypothetical protein
MRFFGLTQAQNAGIREYWEAKAWQGDASALYEVAKMYDTGAFGTKPDLLNAAEAYKAVRGCLITTLSMVLIMYTTATCGSI